METWKLLALHLDFVNLLIYLNQTKGEESLPSLGILACIKYLENMKIHFSGCKT